MKQEKQDKLIKVIFYTLIVLFTIIAFVILSPFEILSIHTFFPIILMIVITFFILGIALVVLTRKSKLEGKQRRFLILTGTSASGFFIGVILHNFLYALGIITNSIPVLHFSFEFLHGAFFIIAVLVCPIGFIVGVVGSLVNFRKSKV